MDLVTETEIKQLALIMTVDCVRNTVIEDYHARGSLSQADMKAFNKEVANHIYTWLHFLMNGSLEEWMLLCRLGGMFEPYGWAPPQLDGDTLKAMGMLSGLLSEKIVSSIGTKRGHRLALARSVSKRSLLGQGGK